MDVGIENQADNRHADNGQQNAARHLHFFQTNDHREANQRHHHRETVKVAQRHRQTVQRVFDHQTNAVGGDQQQEQANPDPGTMRHALRQVTQDPAADAGCRDHRKQDPHQEYCAEGYRNTDLLPQHQAEGGEGGQRDSATDRHRQIRP